ncbi:MAG: universal stress protein [Thermoanaerobaculia bacterium]|nr:universal stress protein [Thermoanaerobaculia bacterium]
MSRENRLTSVFHPSDFSGASEVAFCHALKIALVTRARLSMLHVSASHNVDWDDFPGVRSTLERWGLIPQGSPKSAVGKLGIDVKKALATAKNPVAACLGYLEKEPADLIVLAVSRSEGRVRWLEKSIGKPVARKSGQMTLFLPAGVPGFVSSESGSVSLDNILIPISHSPRPEPGVEAASRIIQNLNLPEGTVTLLHAGAEGEAPEVEIPRDTGWTWRKVTKKGEPADVIVQAAGASRAGLIIMTTDGPDGFLDALRGTTSERVLNQAACPVLNLPVGSLLG